ncbi:MAG: RNA polymerase sigma factor [Phycisphaerales bacterium]
MKGSTDFELLLLTHGGNADAAVALWARFGPRMIALACAVLRERDTLTAQDVVQGVFVRLLALERRTIRDVKDVAAWLSRLTRNAALNHIRENSRRRARVQRATQGKVVYERGSAGMTAGPLPPDLREALDALPDEQRDTILLKHVAGLTFDQMAHAMEENRNTIASRYRAAMAHLRRVLGEQENDGSHTPPMHLVGASR